MWDPTFKAFFRIRPISISNVGSDCSSSFHVAKKLKEIQTLLKVGSEYACEKTSDYSSEGVNRPVTINENE